MILFNSLYSGWVEVTRDQAKDLVNHIINHANAIKPSEINNYINTKKLKGITVEMLMKEV